MDRETLGKFVDELIKKQPLDVANVDELNARREAAIKELDDRVATAIFSQFSQEMNVEFNQLLDRNAEPTEYDQLFERNGINIDQIITDTLQKFAQDFLKGAQNE